MNVFAISGLLNGIAATGLALLVYFRDPQNPRHWTYGLFGLATAVWSFGYFFWQIAESNELALLFTRILMAGAIFMPSTYLHHLFTLRNEHIEKWNILKANYLVGGFFLLTDITPYFVADVVENRFFLFWPVPGALFHIFLVWWVGEILYMYYLLWDAYTKGVGVSRQQYRYLIVATLLGSIGGITNFPLWYGYEVLPYGNFLFAFYISLVAYTLLRYHLMDFSVIVEKGLSYLTVLLLISQPAYPVLLLAQKSVFGAISYRYSMVQLFVHLLTVAGAYQMRLGTRRAIAHSILKGHDSGLQKLSEFSSNIAALHDMKLLGKEIVQTMSRGMRAQTALLFVLNEVKNKYVQVSDFGLPHHSSSHMTTFAVTDALPRYLAIVQARVVTHELRQSAPDQWKQAVWRDLEQLHADVCFPFIRKNRLLGFCVISPCMLESLEAAETLGFLSTMVREAALALENAILREEVLRSQAIVRHMDRLRSLETMSVSLAHELKNPETSIKAFVQLAQLRKNDEEFLSRLQEVVSADVTRIETLTKEIREYAVNDSSDEQRSVDINELIESSVSFVLLNPEYRHVRFQQVLEPDLPLIRCQRQEMRQVVFNLLLYHLHRGENAEMELFIKSHIITSSAGDRWVQVEISDVRNKSSYEVLSPPLSSSEDPQGELGKSDLTDQGLVIAQEIVQTYDGYIQVYGSTKTNVLFLLSLPIDKREESRNFQKFYEPKGLSHHQKDNQK